ncbi:MAG: hypothetical protein IID45_12370 [Planctomycetes bacterium]|nr:hypothetical protein [Planctomycetota bacterium]
MIPRLIGRRGGRMMMVMPPTVMVGVTGLMPVLAVLMPVLAVIVRCASTGMGVRVDSRRDAAGQNRQGQKSRQRSSCPRLHQSTLHDKF